MGWENTLYYSTQAFKTVSVHGFGLDVINLYMKEKMVLYLLCTSQGIFKYPCGFNFLTKATYIKLHLGN